MSAPDCAEKLRVQLVETLVAEGRIRSEQWRRAFERVPRHLFVPRFYRYPRYPEPGRVVVDGSDPEQREEWLASVYSDRVLNILWDEDRPLVNSTSSKPSVMAEMLKMLDVHDGHTVLEVGTGSGYNAALLCERLGSERVTTVDIDPSLIEAAVPRLRAAGYTPVVAVADGFEGYPHHAPYDRIIATCEVRRVPAAWLEQTRPGGLILAVLPHGMALLSVAAGGSAEGHFHPQPLDFMRMREHSPSPPPREELVALVSQEGVSRPLAMDLARRLHDEDAHSAFWFFERLLVLRCEEMVELGPGAGGVVDLTDGSWTRFDLNEARVIQGGPRRLRDATEELYLLWTELGRPGRERFGLTVTPDGRHVAWLDSPDSPHRWELAG
jgi:protein-L-isoaspartate O-methyltransferase